MSEPVNIARCPEHGLHGARDHCFVCHGTVEQEPHLHVKGWEHLTDEERALIGKIVQRGFDRMTAARARARFTEFRPDGWPLCPQCGDDELYSLANPATIATIQGCYRCDWKPRQRHRIETYKPRPRPEGETRRRIAEAVAQPGGPNSKHANRIHRGAR